MQNKLFDTHAHLDDKAFNHDRGQVIARAVEGGVEYIVNIGGSIGANRRTMVLTEEYSFIYAATGIHPHDASCATQGVYDELLEQWKQPKCRCIGEIGLDYHYDLSPRDVQMAVFIRQMEYAAQLGMRVIIHSREATEDTLAVLKKFPDVVGVVHCFSGSVETAKILVDIGYTLSFTGVITYKNAIKSQQVVQWLPADKIMAETDAPYLTPVPHRGERNESLYVSLVVQKMAELRGISYQEMAEITYKNGRDFYGID